MAAADNAYSSHGHDERLKLSPATRIFHSLKYDSYIVAIIGFKTSIDPNLIKTGLEQTLIKHPRFSSKLVKDEGWIPSSVNLEEHVIVASIDEQIDDPDRFMEDYISHMTKTPLDFCRPLWELHILNLKTSQSEASVVFRIHHSVGDGVSLMSLLLSCTRQTSDPEKLPTLPAMNPTQKSSSATTNFNSIWQFWLAVWSAVLLVWNTVVDFVMYAATILFLKDTNTPIKGQKGCEFAVNRFVHRTVSLDDIKLIKDAMNATVNDVLVGVTQAGFSQYLNRRYGDTHGKDDKGNYLPKGIRLRARIAVNLRPVKGIQALADLMSNGTKTKWGNLYGFILLPFKIALRDDPLDYVRAAKSTVDRKKNSGGIFCTYLLNKIILKTLGIKALSIQFQSYVNKMTMALGVDPNVIPDPHQLLDDMEESLKLIKEAVLKQRLAAVEAV
ncbi:wax ester synthase/diacylglycerol acyltransferase 5-like isoform X2 [Humulus lupulus]|uniref:wax ester synthase/diacylglycerol acyltransferase 5-like isoform X2 n=1 Tax=Humulus lupulus TaxID=3486 RepID=UPI002B405CDE|nr:wax ester synthase/diacylglycerol acyltransferase 5-like isoform X2 [Humulus lupulus]